jgi:hypothetical protein
MIERDKVFHIGGGALTAAAVIVLVHVAASFGIAWACLAGAVLVGIGYEVQQKIRGEGVPSWPDALATAAGGAIVALIAQVP